jgi:hypothetical protein
LAASSAVNPTGGRADDNLTEFFSLYVIQHLENRRETQFYPNSYRQFKFAYGREIFDRDVANLQLPRDVTTMSSFPLAAPAASFSMVVATPLTSSSVSVNHARLQL